MGRPSVLRKTQAGSSPPAAAERRSLALGGAARLPPSDRAVVLLSEDEGLTNGEIAEALGVRLDTVKIGLRRARGRLTSELGTGCTFYRDERNQFVCVPKGEGYPRATDLRL